MKGTATRFNDRLLLKIFTLGVLSSGRWEANAALLKCEKSSVETLIVSLVANVSAIGSRLDVGIDYRHKPDE